MPLFASSLPPSAKKTATVTMMVMVMVTLVMATMVMMMLTNGELYNGRKLENSAVDVL